ncbi:MAG TPA: thioredoxin family protein [Tepidisphaeraceae bacterium]|jgi:thiol-disulfide isomerase/thioredoxin
MDSTAFKSFFDQALPYSAYIATGTTEQQRRWAQVYEATRITDAQRALFSGFARQMPVLVVSGIWCGDCVQQVPLLQRLAELSTLIDLRVIDRDAHKALSSAFRINGGDRVPVVLLLSEDFELCAAAGDRSLARYRAIAVRQLGAACPVGITAPDEGELAATLADWAGEMERVQLMLRVSPRLRKIHND